MVPSVIGLRTHRDGTLSRTSSRDSRGGTEVVEVGNLLALLGPDELILVDPDTLKAKGSLRFTTPGYRRQ